MNSVELEKIFAWFVNGVSNCCELDKSPESVNKCVKEYYGNLHDAIRKFVKIDFYSLTSEECDLLGFGYWASDDDVKDLCGQIKLKNLHSDSDSLLEEITELKKTSGLRLIPLWLYSQIPNGFVLTDIYGKKIIFDGTNDKETRLGCLAYGIYPIDVKVK